MTPKQQEYLEALRDGRAPGSVAAGAAGTRIRSACLAKGWVRYEQVTRPWTNAGGSPGSFTYSRVVLTDEGRAALAGVAVPRGHGHGTCPGGPDHHEDVCLNGRQE